MWLHEYANAEEEVWRECIRPSIKQALYLLSDEDPWNDQRAYAQLGQALLLAGDVLNASIALGVSTKPLEEQCSSQQQLDHEENTLELVSTTTESAKQHPEGSTEQAARYRVGDSAASLPPDHQDIDSTTAEDVPVDALEGCPAQVTAAPDDDDNKSAVSTVNPKYAGFECLWGCDGRCETPQESYAELYFCRVCNDVCFCEKCIVLVRNDELPFRCCAKDHPFVRAFPMIEEARRVTDALVERRFEVQQAWLEGLRKVWED